MIIVRVTMSINNIGGIIETRLFFWAKEEGRRMATSRSNTRNKIMIRKNLVEKDLLFLLILLNPHSNWVFFSIVGYDVLAVIMIVKDKNRIKNKDIIKKEDIIDL